MFNNMHARFSEQPLPQNLLLAIREKNEVRVRKIIKNEPNKLDIVWTACQAGFDIVVSALLAEKWGVYLMIEVAFGRYNRFLIPELHEKMLMQASAGPENEGYQTIINLLMQLTESRLINSVLEANEMAVTELLHTHQNEIIPRAIYLAFEFAAERGFLQIVNLVLDNSGHIISEIMKGNVLAYVCNMGSYDVAKLILEKTSHEIPKQHKEAALKNACRNGHDKVVEVLLADPSVASVAICRGRNTALIEAQHRICGAENDEERGRYQNIINGLMQIDSVRRLAENHANRVTNLADRTFFAENSMAEMTYVQKDLVCNLERHYGQIFQQKKWHTVRLEILNYIETEYRKDPAIDGYHRVWMLEDNAIVPVNFFPADTIGIHPHGEMATIYWKDINSLVHKKEVMMADVLRCYENLNKQHWLHQDAQDIRLVDTILETFDINHHPYQGRECPLKYESGFQNESALVAYYRHSVHNAWRYLSDNNPWMSLQAKYIERRKSVLQEVIGIFIPNLFYNPVPATRRSIISEYDKKLISLFWMALDDDTVVLEPGFNQIDNKKVFITTIAENNRAHNRDEKAENPNEQERYNQGIRWPEIKTTIADLFANGDEPGCGQGGTQRMLEICELGHPYINASNVRDLSLNILKDRIESHLIKPKCQDASFDNVIDKIKKLENKRILEYIQQRISDIYDLDLYDEENKIVLSEVEEQQYKSIITFPPEQIEHFLNDARLWFTAERIDKQHEEKLKLRTLDNTDSEFFNKKHDSCADFIIYCCQNENILQVSPKIIYDAVNCRLNDNVFYQQPIILNYFNDLNSRVANERECGNKRAREEEISPFNKRRK